MHVEFRRVVVPGELRALLAFDRKVFARADLFPTAAWRQCESHWMIVDGARAGCAAFLPHVDFQEDVRDDGENPALSGSLYIATTGLLPRFQGRGLGQLMKAWQVAYARHHGFHRIVTNTREGNHRMIALNRKFGFRVVRTTPGYYSDPADATVVMELNWKIPAAAAPRTLR